MTSGPSTKSKLNSDDISCKLPVTETILPKKQ